MATLIFRRALFYGISALIPLDASVSVDLVEMDCVVKLMVVVYDVF
jgi:hypothetical protein